MVIRGVALLSVLLFCIGCGSSEIASVSGTVTFAGKEVTAGALRFFPMDGTLGNGAGAMIEGGRFEISEEIAQAKGLLAGNYRISVSASRKTGRKFRNPEGDGSMIDETTMYIPERYNLQTELVVELKPGPNQHDLDLVP